MKHLPKILIVALALVAAPGSAQGVPKRATARGSASTTIILFHSVPASHTAQVTAAVQQVIAKLPAPWQLVIVDPWRSRRRPVLSEVSSDAASANRQAMTKVQNGLRQATRALDSELVTKALFEIAAKWPSIARRNRSRANQPRLIVVGNALPGGDWVDFGLQRLALRGFAITFLHHGIPAAKRARALKYQLGAAVQQASFARLGPALRRIMTARPLSQSRHARWQMTLRRKVFKTWYYKCLKVGACQTAASPSDPEAASACANRCLKNYERKMVEDYGRIGRGPASGAFGDPGKRLQPTGPARLGTGRRGR